MLIEYAINYYCWARLQAFILLRMYGCGRSIDVVPASTSHLSLHTSSESQSVHMFQMSTVRYSQTACLAQRVTLLTAA